MSKFDLQKYKNTFADPATTGMRIMHRQWTVDESYEIVAEVERLREGTKYTGDLYDQAREEFAGDMGWDHDLLKEQIASLTEELNELKDDLQAEMMDCADVKKRLTTSEQARKDAEEGIKELKQGWSGNLACNLCGAVFPNSHTSPCTP